jgi:hypothetical protein
MARESLIPTREDWAAAGTNVLESIERGEAAHRARQWARVSQLESDGCHAAAALLAEQLQRQDRRSRD